MVTCDSPDILEQPSCHPSGLHFSIQCAIRISLRLPGKEVVKDGGFLIISSLYHELWTSLCARSCAFPVYFIITNQLYRNNQGESCDSLPAVEVTDYPSKFVARYRTPREIKFQIADHSLPFTESVSVRCHKFGL